LITVCRLDPAKNTASIIQALPQIRQQHPQTVLHIVGDGPAMPHLRHLVHELGLKDAIIFHGNRSHEEVMQLLGQAHLFVFPTRVNEGFPKAVLEAMACGLPVVATRVSVIPHLIGEERGLVLDNTSPEAVAQAVLTLIADPTRMAAMGRNGRVISRRYTLEAWRDTIGEYLRAAWGPLRSDEQA
jgi:colanic acid/amylovoran biosynthesis glycosyltransferase